MKILYAGYGSIGLVGLINILSTSRTSVDDIYLLDEVQDDSPSADLIRNYAEIYGIKFLSDLSNTDLEFDLLISVHWRKCIDIELIKSARIGGFNLHPSLLPKYAGCSSLAWALINGEETVGYNKHLLGKDFDTSDIILQEEIHGNDSDNAVTLWNKVNLLDISNINRCIDLGSSRNQKFIAQDLSQRTYYSRGFPNYEEIKKKLPNLSYPRYLRASYFPNKSS